MLVPPLLVSLTVGNGLRLWGSTQVYLLLLLLLLGISGSRPRRLWIALVVGLAVGVLIRVLPPSPVEWLFVSYGITDPSLLLAAIAALHAPAWCLHALGPASDRAFSTQRNPAWIQMLPYAVLIALFILCNLGFLIRLSPSLRLSIAGPACLYVVALAIGLADGPRARGRVVLALSLPLLAIASVAFALGETSWTVRRDRPWPFDSLGISYGFDLFDWAQSAVITFAFAWLGAKASAGILRTMASRAGSSPAVLPQLQFAWMDVLLIVVASALLGARLAVGVVAV